MEMSKVEAAVQTLKEELRSLDPAMVDRGGARRLVTVLAEGERVCAGATALLASRIGDPGALARQVGTTVGKARAVLDLSRRLGDTPALNRAVRAAEVSLDQATEIAKAATQAPGSVEHLVEVARSQPFHELRREARAAVLDDDRHRLAERQRRARQASHRVTDLGMIHIEADLEPHVGAPIVDRLEAEARRLARSDGSRHPSPAHLADAFAEAFTGAGGRRGSKPEMVIVVSHEVATRGWGDVADGEVCDIPGVGPVDPMAARRIAEDAFLTGVFYDGTDLRHLKRWTRHIPTEVRLALRLGDPPSFDGPACVDCGNRYGLDFDHVTPLSDGGPTALANLDPRCKHRCHPAKTATDRRAAAGGGARVAAARGQQPP